MSPPSGRVKPRRASAEQYTKKRDGFGLDTDRKRLERLFFQPRLVAWALWSTRR